MSAKIIREGFSTAGFDSQGNFQHVGVALVVANIPGPQGDICFVVVGNYFWWVRGLPTGEGFEMSQHELVGPKSTWKSQIAVFSHKDPVEEMKKEGTTRVSVGTKYALYEENYFIIAE